MKAFKRKELVISIIKDDLVNTKLVDGLESLNLEAGDYTLYASGTILKLMRIKSTGNGKRWEEIHDEYIRLSHKIRQIDITDFYLVHALAEEIYKFLKKERAKEKALRAAANN